MTTDTTQDEDVFDDTSAAVEAEDTIEALTEQPPRASTNAFRPRTAPPRRTAPASLEPNGLKVGVLRPTSAKPRPAANSPPHIPHQKTNVMRPTSAPSARHTSISQAYLKQAAHIKRSRERAFATELFQEKADFEKKIALKINQGNKLMRRLNIPKSFQPARSRDDFLMVRVLDPPLDRLIPADTFHILFHLTSANSSSSGHVGDDDEGHEPPKASKIATARLQSKKDIQDGLRMVLKSTIELTAILQEQLFELQRKGWNASN
ncbi:hypothetical protein AeRB84_007139 [Aphanomyces euteiches]|nr:hypothetical protein AeRB84_009766 [Aphanomyces euteiches]KAH9149947.1 hypothetical protein AeRB84_007139 [Aphanomyces euteiches]